ncbi:hypothetical protein [Halocynthiibacter namhaensis]|uniref:hypothetical protein n=1 Tax=Halocynthiibacter namhaensis TaxID=1290553 RepID=UPI001EE32BFA|nr:hypothetical protein [Halocynthiibacter namhaensis]
MEQPPVIAAIFVISCLLLGWSGAYQLLFKLPFITAPEVQSTGGIIVTTIIAAILFTGNIILISLLRIRWQIAIVWAELFGCFMIFFFSFDLNFRSSYANCPSC